MFHPFLSTGALREHSRERKNKENQEEEEAQEWIFLKQHLPNSSSFLSEEKLDGKSLLIIIIIRRQDKSSWQNVLYL